MGTSSDLGQPFPRQKERVGLGKRRYSHYDIHADGALLPSINWDNKTKFLLLLTIQCFSESFNSK